MKSRVLFPLIVVIIFLIGFMHGRSAQAGEVTNVSTFETGFTTEQAFCRRPFPNLETIRAELVKMTAANPTATTGVGGVMLKDENPQLIASYRMLTSHKTYKFKFQKDIDLWELHKNSNCDKALCASEKVFGPDLGPKFLYIAAKYGVVLSSLGFDLLRAPAPSEQLKFDTWFTVRPWTSEELAPYLQALTMLPEASLPLPWIRMTHSGIINPMNSNILSNGTIQFYNNINELSDSVKEQTTYHEIAHNMGFSLGFDRSAEWIEVSGWAMKDGKATNLRPNEFVTRYAAVDMFEDFAESFTYYRYYPAQLKKISPARYEYMKKIVYGDKEYLDDAICK